MTARAALAAGRIADVRRLAAGMTAAPGTAAEGHFLLGLVAALDGKVANGIALIDHAIMLGETAEYHAQRARLLILLRRDADARVAAERAEALSPVDALTHDTIGCVHARLGDHHTALRSFERAVWTAPEHIEHRYNLAAALAFVGRTVEAEREHEAVLLRDGGYARSHHALAGLRRHSADRNHVARLETALAAAAAPTDRLRIGYALAKECEDIGAAADSFRHLAAANAVQRSQLDYDFAQDAAMFDTIERAFADPAYFAGGSVVADAPIFVLGMPRTGTTLVDRILSSHPRAESAGELQAMPLAIKHAAATTSRRVIDAATIAAVANASPDVIGHAYLARAGQHRRRADGRFIDKLPANFLYIGHIARALPNASIVCLRRNAMDTVYANYKNLFATTSTYYHYSYNLVETARYYARFDRLMALWRGLFPGRVVEIGYEALVDDQEAETRRLLTHCRLDWDPACLDFHANTAPVATPSAAQVRRPMYRDAVARWRTHAEALAPARAWLEAAGIAIE